jgi:acyl-CoA reductase-like NAD-dependent aldehyde dehydrogenase
MTNMQPVDPTDPLYPATIVATVKTAARDWATAGLEQRLEVLQAAGAQLLEQRPQLEQALLSEGFSADIARDYAEWILYAGNPKLLAQYANNIVQWVATGNGGELMVRRPDGVIVLYAQAGSAAFNAATLFSMLLVGNGVIIVRAPMADKALRLIVEGALYTALEQHGFSSQLLPIITERYREMLPQLIAAPDVRTLVCIGSAVDNRTFGQQARELGKKLVVEHYGRGCLVVWRDGDVARAVESACRLFDLSAKPCFVPKHFFIHSDIFEQFVAGVLARLPQHAKTIEADKQHGVLSPMPQMKGFFAMLAQAREVGELRAGGYQMAADGTESATGYHIAPTVVTLDAEHCFTSSLKCIDEEIFYPLMPIVRFSGSDDQVLAQMSQLIKREPIGLRASIWSNTSNVIAHFTREIDLVSMLRFNSDHSPAPNYASFWGSSNGDNHLFWERTSHLQAIDCNQLTPTQIQAVLAGLGCQNLVKI